MCKLITQQKIQKHRMYASSDKKVLRCYIPTITRIPVAFVFLYIKMIDLYIE